MTDTYSLIDSGNGKKIEKFGSCLIVRPAAQAIWQPQLPEKEWRKADAEFSREGKCRWVKKGGDRWEIELAGIRFLLSATDFGHLGLFPEQKDLWLWMRSAIKNRIKEERKEVRILNLFAYSGGATLVAAEAGAHVTHLDASKGMVSWARENALLNGLQDKPIRWIVDDVIKFLDREKRRGRQYEGIILDPPTYGRGSQGQVFKFERDLLEVLRCCKELLSDRPLFLLLSSHTPNITPLGLQNILLQTMNGCDGQVECGEMLLKGNFAVFPLPNGIFARWHHG
ncbi:MAG: Ribosomal RNA large subunit methyltransferase K [Chlamydiae bacterium]|nr:Ribosomal RNA large subunit methyltransferase K [Chlamydiota bacterium]